MSVLLRAILITAICVISMTTGAIGATQQQIDTARAKGLAWLFQNQNGDGSWKMSSGLKIQPTSAVLEAFLNAGIMRGYSYAAGVSWLGNAEALTADSLARQASTLFRCGENVGILMNKLNDMVHPASKSWGAYPKYYGSFPDTSLAIDAAVKTNSSAISYLSTSVSFVTGRQIANNNGWPYSPSDSVAGQNRLIPTLYNIIALSHYKKLNSGVDGNISRAVTWLATRQKGDGGFADDPNATSGNVYETALAYLALNEAKLAGNAIASASSAAMNSAQNFLITNQQANGGWGTDPLQTALALQTLPVVSLADTDNDGIPNVVEAILGTNPHVADSRWLAKGNGVITVIACQNQPVRILQTNTYYTSLAAALGAVAAGQTIQLLERNFVEGAVISKTVTLDGGYDCDYRSKTGLTVLEGELRINGGTVRMNDVRIAGTTPATLPMISVAPNSDSFGRLYINNVSEAHPFTISNSGGANLIIATAVLSGANSGEFVKTSDTCTGMALAPETNCTIRVEFFPKTTGPKTALLTITSNASATPAASVTLNGISVLPTLSAQKAGTGAGTVSSSPAGISCGSGCSGDFAKGSSVALAAAPDADSSFAGWSEGCSGAGVCTVAMNADLSVTAIFNKRPPVASFSATSTNFGAPSLVNFSDTSQFAASWLWDFGDGTTGAGQNPGHIYKKPGSYTVKLTAANVSGSSSASKIITVNPCGTLPVKTGASYYPTLQAAYNAAGSGNTIQALAVDFAENLAINRAIPVTLEGGYMCGFGANPPDVTTINGEPHISGGAITIRNIHIR